ncbi:Uncharacterised protein [Candidatus Anstonella stagnisolia]|nr:Uncharacterised protein [Candidatus Anstonella stagnisolia]
MDYVPATTATKTNAPVQRATSQCANGHTGLRSKELSAFSAVSLQDSAAEWALSGKPERRDNSPGGREQREHYGHPVHGPQRLEELHRTQEDLAAFYNEDFEALSNGSNRAANEAHLTSQAPQGEKRPNLMDTGFALEFPPSQTPPPVRADNLNEGFPSSMEESAPKGPSGKAAHAFPPFKGLVEEPMKSEPLPAPNAQAATPLNLGFPAELLRGSV